MANFLTNVFQRQTGRRVRVERVPLLLTPELLDPLDIFCRKQGGLSRAAAVQLLLRDGLFRADLSAPEPEDVESSMSQQAFEQPEAAAA